MQLRHVVCPLHYNYCIYQFNKSLSNNFISFFSSLSWFMHLLSFFRSNSCIISIISILFSNTIESFKIYIFFSFQPVQSSRMLIRFIISDLLNYINLFLLSSYLLIPLFSTFLFFPSFFYSVLSPLSVPFSFLNFLNNKKINPYFSFLSMRSYFCFRFYFSY